MCELSLLASSLSISGTPRANCFGTSYGCWRYRGFTIQAIEQENQWDGQRFQFVAVAKTKNLQFPQLMQGGIWLDGVRHGMDHPGDKPVMVRRPYQTEATTVDDATDLTVAT